MESMTSAMPYYHKPIREFKKNLELLLQTSESINAVYDQWNALFL